MKEYVISSTFFHTPFLSKLGGETSSLFNLLGDPITACLIADHAISSTSWIEAVSLQLPAGNFQR